MCLARAHDRTCPAVVVQVLWKEGSAKPAASRMSVTRLGSESASGLGVVASACLLVDGPNRPRGCSHRFVGEDRRLDTCVGLTDC